MDRTPAALTSAQRQRAIGAVLGMATGDALGAGYEFGPALPADHPVAMIGSAVFEPGEWTDDTSMAVPILQALAEGADLLDPITQDRVATTWREWAREAKDVGIHTSEVLGGAPTPMTAAGLARTAADKFAAGRSSAGNGTLMRTAPIVLGYLHDPEGLTRAASEYSLLTHGDPSAAQACVLWNQAQRHAIMTGALDIRIGLAHLDPEAAATWSVLLEEAEAGRPVDFHEGNGWVVRALQAAWAAIASTPVPELDTAAATFPADHFAEALRTAVRVGNDADTVAAIAGGMLGAVWGVSAIPATWRRRLHGWPGITGQELLRLAGLALGGGQPDGQGWPTAPRIDYSTWQPAGRAVPHPRDAGVLIGDVRALDAALADIGAVVSLCRLGTAQSPAPGLAANTHVEFWLIDTDDRAENPNLEFLLQDAATIIGELRDEGRTVLLHCVAGESRTPTVAAVYGAQVADLTAGEALAEVREVLPQARPNATFLNVLQGWHRRARDEPS